MARRRSECIITGTNYMKKITLKDATNEQIEKNIFDHAEDWGITGIVGDTEGFEVEVFERGEDYIYVYISGVWHRLQSKYSKEVITQRNR